MTNLSQTVQWNDSSYYFGMINEDPMNIRYVPTEFRTEELKLSAVEKDGNAIFFISNPSEVIQLAAIHSDPYAFNFIENPTEAAQHLVLRKTRWRILFN